MAILPYLTTHNAREAITFYKTALAAELTEEPHIGDDSDKVLNAMMTFETPEGPQRIMLMDAFPEFGGGSDSPTALGATTVSLHIELTEATEVDAFYNRFVEAGGIAAMEPSEQFWGDYFAMARDPFGHIWSFGAPSAQENREPATSLYPN